MTGWMTKMISERQAERRACKQTGRLEEGKGRGRLVGRQTGGEEGLRQTCRLEEGKWRDRLSKAH